MKTRLTKALLDATEPRETPFEIRDDSIRGLLARVQPTGRITLYLEYYNGSGKRNRLKLGRHGDATMTELRERAEDERARVTLGADVAREHREERQDLTLQTFIENQYTPWARDNLKAHESTLRRLESGFRPLWKKRLTELDSWTFEKHRSNRLKKKLPKARKLPSPATINRDFAHLRAALSKAVEWRMLETNPLAGVKAQREDKNRAIRAISSDEEKAILAVFTERHTKRVKARERNNKRRKLEGRPLLPDAPRYRDVMEPMFLLLLDSGLRRGEAFSLEWQDVDFHTRTLTVHGKGAKSSQSRTIPLTARVVGALAAWKAQKGAERDLVFPSKYNGGRLDSIDGAWRSLLADAGVSGLRVHDLRHSFCSRLALAGVPITVIQRLAGHSTITTTARYLHATARDAENAIAQLEKANGQ